MNARRIMTEKIDIDRDACKGCHLCIDQCPEEVLSVSEKRSAKGYLMPVAESLDDCIACMLCEMICPDLAITVEARKNEK